MTLLKEIFTWWNGQTLVTGLATRFFGINVGTDKFGNKYYKNKIGSKRWVIYNGVVEASKVPPLWHAWLHQTIDEVPEENTKTKHWQKSHQQNLTGSDRAYHPLGKYEDRVTKKNVHRDYEAWKP